MEHFEGEVFEEFEGRKKLLTQIGDKIDAWVKKHEKGVKFVLDILGPGMILTAALITANDGHAYVSCVTTEGEVIKIRGKKCKTLRTVKAVKEAGVIDTEEK